MHNDLTTVNWSNIKQVVTNYDILKKRTTQKSVIP